MTRLRHLRPADERGIALVMAMLVMTVLAIALSSVIYFTSTNQRTSAYAKQAQVATTLAEAGINNAVAVLTNPSNANYLVLPNLLPPRTSTYEGGTVMWQGTIDSQHWVWHLTSTSTVANPTGPNAAPIRKTMAAKIQVRYTPSKDLQIKVWNWLYSPKAANSGTCDTSFDQGVTIRTPVYVGGNLCLSNNANVQAPIYVGGWAQSNNPGSSIGLATAPVSDAVIRNGCQWHNQPWKIPCVVETATTKTHVWVNRNPWDPNPSPAALPTVFQGIDPPVICWGPGDCPGDPVGGWYSAASPGPKQPCETSSGTPPVFDNNTTFGSPDPVNGSVPGRFNLTPDGASYSCKTVNGELSWNAATRTLTAQGVIFIDGNVYATTSGNTPITYKGWGSGGACTAAGDCQAVLFVTGTFALYGEKLCAVVSGSDCDRNAWDPNKKLLLVLAHGHGGYVAANDGVEVTTSQTEFQGGLYADWNVVAGQGAWVQGPLVSGRETITVGQQNDISFPELKIAPLAIQGPPGHFWVEPPYDFTG